MTFAQRLETLRLSKGFTQEEIADNPAMQWDICVWRTTPERDNYYQDKAILKILSCKYLRFYQ